MTTTKKRSYNRRSEDDLIAELQAKIAEIEERKKRREVMQSPLAKDFDKFKKQAAKFTQACMDNNRKDVANSMMALMATMERQLKEI